jgi:hypothetical protein
MLPEMNPAADPEVKALTVQTEQFAALALTYKVSTPVQYADAGEQLKQVKAAMKRLDDLRKGMTRPLDAAKKAIMDFFRAPEEKLVRAESGIKRAMIAYTDEQERIRREEQRKAEEAARRERERLEAIARETERKAREKAEAERKAAEAAAAAGRAAEAAKLMAKAAATEERAAAKAEEAAQQAAMVVAPVIQREAPKVPGISSRETWHAECVDLRALVKAVHEGRAPLSFLIANDKVLGQQARSLKADLVCDGVRVWSKSGLASDAA